MRSNATFMQRCQWPLSLDIGDKMWVTPEHGLGSCEIHLWYKYITLGLSPQVFHCLTYHICVLPCSKLKILWSSVTCTKHNVQAIINCKNMGTEEGLIQIFGTSTVLTVFFYCFFFFLLCFNAFYCIFHILTFSALKNCVLISYVFYCLMNFLCISLFFLPFVFVVFFGEICPLFVKFCEFCFLTEFREFLPFSISRKTGDSTFGALADRFLPFSISRKTGD